MLLSFALLCRFLVLFPWLLWGQNREPRQFATKHGHKKKDKLELGYEGSVIKGCHVKSVKNGTNLHRCGFEGQDNSKTRTLK